MAWIRREPEREIPWTPLDHCTVALISTASVALKNDRPFDQEGARQDPWWGDSSYRIIPRETTEQDVNFYHLHMKVQLC